jgi:sugar (pentulose or hexulose) kinase
MGGSLRLARLITHGCPTHQLCTGPQIWKMHQTQPQVYTATETVSLVSSFMGSLLVGAYACMTAKGGQNTLYPIPEPELPEPRPEVPEPEIPDHNLG